MRQHDRPSQLSRRTKTLAQLGLTLKKTAAGSRTGSRRYRRGTHRMVGADPRTRYHQAGLLDETWATTNMARTHGRAPRGQRLIAAVPHGHWHITTFLCGLRHDRLVAPLVLDGAIDGPSFLAWVEQFLAPTLVPGDIVIADNLSSHKIAGAREAIEAQGASLWFLPSYSPDLNPIEQVFSKLKRLLRSTAARTVDALWAAIGQLLAQFDPAECANYLRHCGYAHSGR